MSFGLTKDELKFEIHKMDGFTDAERDKFIRATAKAQKILNSKKFRERFLALPLEQTQNKTNLEIYQMIMSGADKLNKENDGDIDVQITMYYSFNNTVGYTYPDTWFTWINRKFFTNYNEADVACNIMHEYMHNLGFGHRKASDHNSVPYATGYLVEALIREDTGQQEPPPVIQKPESGKKWVCERSWRTLWLKVICHWE